MIQNPFTFVVWAGGLIFLLLPAGRRYRAVAIVFLTATLVLVLNGNSKSEYLASAFAGLFAAGGVAWESWLAPRGNWARGLLVATVALGVLVLPAVLPILPVGSYLRWANAIGIVPTTSEAKELAELPQFYADMFGWEEKARAAAEAYRALPEGEREAAVIYAENYGRSGAIEYFGPDYGIPKGITVGSHNNYWLWGPAGASGEVVIYVGGSEDGPATGFESHEQAGVASCDYCMPYEKDIPIWVARGMRQPVDQVWPLIGHYD